jgi:signal transduction histidine kinase
MKLSFKNRIAFYYMLATAIIMAIAFMVIYFVVAEAVFRHLDNDLSYEARKHTKEISITGDSIQFRNKAEWQEREHREVQVNPVFIQLIDQDGRLMDKSPNLKEDNLAFSASEFGGHFNSQISERAIRQVQLPIRQDGQTVGYILAAMSSESAISTLLKLRNVLVSSYLIALIGLYFISRLLAGRSISPVQEVTNTITRITKYNLKERVELPQNKDEIHELSVSFNSLLDRIENALERERQFTSDASHELRTPLASLRGTLEVLIRKPREQQEYEEKVKFSLAEIEKMTTTLEQLLLLARLDTNSRKPDNKRAPLPTILDESLGRFKDLIADKQLKIALDFDQEQQYLVPLYYTNLIIENVISNAIKYSENNSSVQITIDEFDGQVRCTIQDHGIGIDQQDFEYIYDSFFRSNSLDHKHISGNGLGLSIVKKAAEAIDARLRIESTLGEGTRVIITF